MTSSPAEIPGLPICLDSQRCVPARNRRVLVSILLWGLVCLLVAGPALGLAASSMSLSAHVSPAQAQSGVREDDPSVHFIPLGLDGEITADVVVAGLAGDGKRSVLVGTWDGLYVLADGTLVKYFYTRGAVVDILVADDLTGDGVREVVACIQDTFSPNVRCYDVALGGEVWAFRAMQDAFVEDIGWSRIQTFPVDAIVVDDVNSDGVRDVAFASERCLYLLDGMTGEEVWKLETQDYLYQVAGHGDVTGDGTGDLTVKAGNGVMYAVSGRDGRVLWRKTVAEKAPYVGQLQQCWLGEILPVRTKDGDRAMVSSEDGKVRLIEIGDGSYDWETAVKGGVFGGLRLLKVGDATGDGWDDAVAYCESSEQKRTMVLLDGATGEPVWETEMPDDRAGAPTVAELNGERTILVPRLSDGLEERVGLIDIKDGALVDTLGVACLLEPGMPGEGEVPWQELEPGMSSEEGEVPWQELDSGMSGEGGVRLAELDGKSFLVVSDYGDLVCVSSEGKVLWGFPRVWNTLVQEGRFNADDVPDMLVWSSPREPSPWEPSTMVSGSRVMCAVDGASYGVIWRYEVPYQEMVEQGELSDVKVASDLDLDGWQDILCCHGSRIRSFSGRDGSGLLDAEMGAKAVAIDLFRTSLADVALAAGLKTGLSIVGRNGEKLWEKSYEDWGDRAASDEVRPVLSDDVNGDGADDLVVFLTRKVLVLESMAGSGTLAFTERVLLEAGDGETIVSAELCADMDGDGVRDLMLVRGGPSAVGRRDLVVVSLSTGNVLTEVEANGGIDLNPACADFDGDGYLDSLLYVGGLPGYEPGSPEAEASGRYGGFRSELQVVSGRDGKEVWKLSLAGETLWDKLPGVPVPDMSGDGVTDIAVVVLGGRGRDEMILVYDAVAGTLVRQVLVSGAMRMAYLSDPAVLLRWLSAVGELKVVGDCNGDGVPEVAIFQDGSRYLREYGEYWRDVTSRSPIVSSGEDHPVIVDLSKGEVMSRFLIPGSDIEDLGLPGRLAVVGDSGKLCLIEPQNSLRIASPVEGGTCSSPVRVTWEGAAGDFSLVAIDNIPSVVTCNREAELPVGSGEHEIRVYSVDRYSQVLTASVNIEVRGQPWTLVVTFLGVGLLVVGLFSIRLRRLMASRHGRSTESG